MSILKVVIIGAESTGKSTLCEMLAQHYNTEWCPEFAREYLLTYGTNYTFESLSTIAKGQLALEDEYTNKINTYWQKQHSNLFINSTTLTTINHKPLLFIDTNMYVMKVWSEYVFNTCHSFFLDEIVSRKYDLYLLCNIDLPWVKDELREYPDEKPRKELHNMYKDILINQQTPWVEIKGSHYENRFNQAVTAINKIL
jgi:NadR type nicotinamide-nucleotide adenylyltransferase